MTEPPPPGAGASSRRLAKLVPVAVAAVAGIGLAEHGRALVPWMWCLGATVAMAWFGMAAQRGALLLAVAAVFGLAHALERAAVDRFPLAAELARGREVEVSLTGVVAEAPVRGPGGLRFPIEVEVLRAGGGGWAASSRVLARWVAPAGRDAPGCGDRVRATGWMAAPSGPRNPGEFDAVTWLRREGMVAELRVAGLEVETKAAAHGLRRVAWRFREWLAAAITTGLEERSMEAVVIEAMVLGTREQMAAETEEAFLHSGTLHVFSVSGLHVGLVAVIVWRALHVLRFGRRLAAWCSVPLVLIYALVTGWQPAAVRSALMASVVLVGVGLNRPPRFFNSLCLAAVLILATDSHQLFMAGAQLSFVVIGVIAAVGPPLARRMNGWIHPDPFLPRALWSRAWRTTRVAWGWLSQMLAVSMAAALGSTPLTLWHFQLATPMALAANLLHVPLAGLILATAGLSAATAPLHPSLAAIFAHANWAWARLCLVSADWMSQVPAGSLAWNPRLAGEPAGACRVTVFDVGDGAAVLVRTPEGRVWLFDTGRPGAFRSVVDPGISWYGVRELDGMILSHGDHDHVGGASEALRRYRPRILGHPPHSSRSPAMRAALGQAADVARPLAAGDTLRLDRSTTLRVLWPPAGAAVPLADDGSLVLRLDCAGRSVLFSHDAGFLAERFLALSGDDLRVDVWVRGRHASDLSGLPEFARQLQPSLVVSAGRSNRFWFRDERTVDSALQAAVSDAEFLDQTRTGAVEVTVMPDGSWWYRSWMHAPAADGRGIMSFDE